MRREAPHRISEVGGPSRPAGRHGLRATAGRGAAIAALLGAGLLAGGVPAAAAPGSPGIGIVKVTFAVGNLISPLSTRGVEEAIKRLPGVGEVHADAATGRVQVIAVERQSLDLAQIRDRAARAGFPPTGEPDLVARGKFEIAKSGRIVFRPGGAGAGWQVLESTRLLALFREQPRLQGEYLVEFRLHEKPPWKRPAINLIGGSMITPPSAAPVVRAAGR